MKVKTDYDDLKVKAIINNMKEGQSIEEELHKTMDQLYEQVPGEVRAFISALNGETEMQKQEAEETQSVKQKDEAASKRTSRREQKQKDASVEAKMEEIPQLHM